YAFKKNVFIQLCLLPHGQFSINVDPEWNDNPYNSANGGPCSTPQQFFTNQTAKELFKRRIDYIIARWGYASNLFAWEIFNEVDHTHNYNQNKQNVINWLLEIAQYIKSKDPYQRIVTTSFANEFLEPAIWTSNLFDIIQIHHYNTTSDMQTALIELTKLNLSDYNKPTAIGEYDFLELGYWAFNNDPYGVNLHNSIWTSIMSGAYLTAMTWSWDNYIAPRGLFYHFKGVGEFLKNVNLIGKNFVPITLQTFTSQKSDFPIPPAYPNWGTSPANQFTVSHNGLINPSTINLSKFLYGTAFNTEFRNPPTFFVSYDQVAEFKVVVGNSVSTSPRLQIWLNGIKRLDQIANPNVTYSITVPQGEHQIFIDNQGIDWMRIAEYIFTNFVVAIRAYALKASDEIIGWVHNRNFNWRYLRDIGNIPQPISDGKIFLNDLIPNSIYLIEWWNTQSAVIFKIDTLTVSASNFEINVPTFVWDLAFRLRRIGTTNITEEKSLTNSFYLFDSYPNPFNSSTKIRFYITEPTEVKLSIYNSLGEEVRVLINNQYLKSGEYEVDFNGNDLPAGVYFYQLKSKNFNKIKKMIYLK
ncbi:MAG: T9SS type A sorting domain-containing protein, partial [Ignavibacteria bacterium]|nr:T9SS type A sorting domain-containing protein [Ignavibacteria bacterium]